MSNPNTKPGQLSDEWKLALNAEFDKEYMHKLREYLRQRYNSGAVVYPQKDEIFQAFNLTPLSKVRVVILGQDPYHGPNQAHGLCFSVKPGVKPPPSLANIYRELQDDLEITPSKNGCLQKWAQQGVFLLNSVLTVEEGRAAAHKGQGWEIFTDAVIATINKLERPIIFVLWGSYAQRKGQFINRKLHKVLMSTHPSPLSAYRGFIGCQHFSQINNMLRYWQQPEIDWCVD